MTKCKHIKTVCRFSLLLFCLTSPLLSVAHSKSAADPLSLNQAWQRVMANNPGLKSSHLGIAVTEGDVIQAAVVPNPSVGITIENIHGTGPYNAADSAESTLLMSQPIELGGKRFYRMQTAHFKNHASILLFHASRAQAFQETAELFLSVAEAEAKLQLAYEAVRLNQQTVNTIQQRVTAGRGSLLELKSAQIALTDQQLLAKTAFQQWMSARYGLASLWGGQLNDVQGITLKNFNTLRLVSLSKLMSNLHDNPALKALQQRQRVTQSEVALARANGFPNLTAGVGVRRFNETHDTAYVAEVSMPLPLFDRNQGNTAKALAESHQSVENWLNQHNALQKDLFTTYQVAVQAAIQVNTLQRVVIPEANQALILARLGYSQGRYSYLDLLSTQQKLLDEKSHYITALYTYRKAWITLQILTGALPEQEMS